MIQSRSLCAVLIGLLAAASVASADEITIGASRDCTLHEDLFGDRANGGGEYFHVGTNGSQFIRRGLIAFDIAGNVPAGATITSVSMQLYMSRTTSGPKDLALHRTVTAWNEGPSNPDGNEGGGTVPVFGDTTWIHTFYDTQFWDNSGGDFDPTVSGMTSVFQIGPYTWDSTDQMVADVQGWLDDPSSNHGWMMRSDETVPRTSKRFDSRTNPDPNLRPQLTIEFSTGGNPSDINGDGVVNSVDLALLLGSWGPCPLDNACLADLNGDGDVDADDLSILLGDWG